MSSLESSVKRLRPIEDKYLVTGRDEALTAQAKAYNEYIQTLMDKHGTMKETADSLAELLRREREARAAERSGYQ